MKLSLEPVKPLYSAATDQHLVIFRLPPMTPAPPVLVALVDLVISSNRRTRNNHGARNGEVALQVTAAQVQCQVAHLAKQEDSTGMLEQALANSNKRLTERQRNALAAMLIPVIGT
jgi:uncharacterized Zn finger protein